MPTFDLNARLTHLEELRVLNIELEHRIEELKAPLLSLAAIWAFDQGRWACCPEGRIYDLSPRPIDDAVHFEWTCISRSHSEPAPFRIPLSDLETLLAEPTS